MRKYSSHIIIGIAVLLISVCINSFFASKYPTGYADSDEIITSSYLFTPAHPPGYSQQIILTGLFQHVLKYMNFSPAYAANLFAALLHSVTLLFVYLSAVNIFKYKGMRYPIWISGAVGTFVLGFNGLFWLYSSVIEVMALGDMYVSLILYSVSCWLIDKERSNKWVDVCAVFFGLGIAHLQSIITLVPGLLIFLYANQSNTWSKRIQQLFRVIIISVIVFFLANSLLFWLNGRQQTLAWDFPQSIDGFFYMISRKDYQGNFANKGIVVDNAYGNISGFFNFSAIPIYLTTLWNHMAGIPFIFCIIGLFWLYSSKRKLLFCFLSLYGVAGLLFGLYVTITTPPTALNSLQLIGTYQRQYLIGYTILGFFAVIGCMYIGEYIFNHFKNIYTKISLFIILVCLPVMGEFIANVEMADQRNNDLINTFSQSILDQAESNSVIICSSDIACFNLFYQSLINHYRPDVVILSRIPRARKYFLEQNPDYIGKQDLKLPQFYSQQVTWNVARRPTYLMMPEDYFIKYTGLNGNPYSIVPEGFLFKVETSTPSAISYFSTDNVFRQVKKQESSSRNFLGLAQKDYFASLYVINAKQYYVLNDKEKALKSIDYALSLNSMSQTIKKIQLGIAEN